MDSYPPKQDVVVKMKWSLESQQKFQNMFQSTELQHVAEKYTDGLDITAAVDFMNDCVDELGGDLWGVANPVYSKDMSPDDMVWEMLRFIRQIVLVRGRDREELKLKKLNLHLAAEKADRTQTQNWMERVHEEAIRQINVEDETEHPNGFRKAVAVHKTQLLR